MDININTTNDNIILTSSIIQYNTSDIKRALDTKITEFSNDGYYDYLPFPSYMFELPADEGPFWKRDNIVIKWDYSEPLNDLIPLSNIFLVSASKEELIKLDVETRVKNINWILPQSLNLNMPYHFKIATHFEGQEIFDTSSVFTIDERNINITTNSPPVPIVANTGNTYTIDWQGHGTSDYVRIELLDGIEQNSITFEETIGRLIGNPVGNEPIAPQNNPPLNGDPPNPSVIKILEGKKYVNGDTTYEWTINDIPYDINNVILKITDSFNSFVYDYTPSIALLVPHIGITSFVGRRMGPEVITGVTYGGTGDALLSVYGFNPPNFEVEDGKSLVFNYSSTNAVQVYLTRASKPNESTVFQSLGGTYRITNIVQDDTYVINAKDIHNEVRTATFDITLELEQTVGGDDISEYTLLQLLNHCIDLGEESLTSGDAIIEPGAQIYAKVPQYKLEASQMDESTNYDTVKLLLSLVNEDILVMLWNGQEEPPKIILGAGGLKDRIGQANIEVSKRLEGVPVAGVTISGLIKEGFDGIPGVNIHFNNGGGDTVTGIDGDYIQQVPALWAGKATPTHPSYNFVPLNKDYESLEENRINQNYEGIFVPPSTQLQIITLSLPNGSEGDSYVRPGGEPVQLTAANGTEPYIWSYSGDLPLHLELLPGGKIVGVITDDPSQLGTHHIIIRVDDADNHFDEKDFLIKVFRTP